jgi:hypothetical protein
MPTERETETLWGPLLLSFTRAVRGGREDDAPKRTQLLVALAQHEHAAPLLRLTAMALALGDAQPRRN